MELNGGHFVAEVLKRRGVDAIYTLSGAHIWPIYDGSLPRGIKLVDVRHEQTAAFAAEGHAKLTADLGVAAVTAGPGVTNAVSAVTSASFNAAPVMILGGRAPHARWGSGSLQEMDHVPLMAPITKLSRTAVTPSDVPQAVHEAALAALRPHRGPVFLDFPLDCLFVSGEADVPDAGPMPAGDDPDPDAVDRAADLVARAERPVIVGGSDIWLGRATDEFRRLAETLNMPVVLNGMGRGCLPSSHALCVTRARSAAFSEADVVIVIGTPLDFRLGFGVFGTAKVVHVQDASDALSTKANPECAVSGDLRATLGALLDGVLARSGRPDTKPWAEKLKATEAERRAADAPDLESDAYPIHPARVYGTLAQKLDPDAVVICDGGDFVSFAGKYVDVETPGCWLDPGPFGCLGTGLGYAIAARTVHPDRQIVLMLGDGAFGFGGLDFDTLVRHNLPVVAIVGNNGIWGLEKHPMKLLYGYDVAADLRQETRYDDIVTALGGAGETVEKAGELPAALDRAFDSGVPYLINVLTDPEVVYPRSSNLA